MNSFTLKWKPVVGYEDLYMVSNDGQIKSLDRKTISKNGSVCYFKGRPLEPCNNPYPQVTICKDGKQRCFRVHELLWEAFVGTKAKNGCVNHIDGNKENNNINNLEYTTLAGNIKHAGGLGLMSRGSKHHNSKLTENDIIEIRRLGSQGIIHRAIGAKFGVRSTTIDKICLRKSWRHVK